MNGVVHSGSKVHLLEYVRSLSHPRGNYEIKHRMGDLPRDSGEYLSALRNLRSLALFVTRTEHISDDQFHTCFSAFRETLTHLSLESFLTSFSAFVTLVDYFPNITSLQLRSFKVRPDEKPVPSLSRPLQGKIHLRPFRSHHLWFYDRLAKLDLAYDELRIDTSSLPPSSEARFLESTLQISASTVKILRLTGESGE